MRRALLLVGVLTGCGPRGAAAPPAPGDPARPVVAPDGSSPAPRAEVRIGTVMEVRVPAAAPRAAESELAPRETGAGVGLSRGHVPAVPVVAPRVGSPYAGLDPAIIRRVIRQRMAQFRRCYELAKPQVPARADIRFTVDAAGKVALANVSGLPPVVARCLEAQLRAMQFPAPQGGGQITVSYPFLFKPGADAVAAGPPSPSPAPTRVAERLEPDAPPRPECTSIDPPPALRAALPALTGCYRDALERSPGLSGVLVVTVRADGRDVDGLDEAGLRECALRQTAAIEPPEGGSLAFSIGFATDRIAEALPAITLGNDTVHVGAQIRARKLHDWHMAAGRAAALIDTIAVELKPAPRALLRGHADAPGQGMARAAERLRQRGIDVLVARHRDDGWEPVALAPAALPWRGICPRGLDADADRERAVSVVVTAEGIWVGSDQGRAHLVRQRAGLDTIGYARVLRDLKRGPLGGRADAEIAATREVPWTDLARAVDILHDTGFFELVLVPVAEDDPRHQ